MAELEQSSSSEIAVGVTTTQVSGQKRSARQMESTDEKEKTKKAESAPPVKRARVAPSPEDQGKQLIRSFLDQFSSLPLVSRSLLSPLVIALTRSLSKGQPGTKRGYSQITGNEAGSAATSQPVH